MTRPRVLDISALLALHKGHPQVFHLLTRADAGEVTVVIPATVLAEANFTMQYTESEWEAILLIAGITVTPLSQHIAVEVGGWRGDLATRHTVHEARAVRGVVVTCDPGGYQGYQVPLLAM
ncbi:PIN domain-containing protein [Micromonospora siamensis]|uniref:PIN domain-containing protein n=1 Tax=Micromonospora siamensis TaxID=299152 RepID=A0A1C5HS39_9ACTN|nr:hypothetical protein [Micromonospora siamensis]SCG48758.1 hypothetical protein GA0074704_2230 [Micromonospora siamensis]